jgi:two-component system response regulator DesR
VRVLLADRDGTARRALATLLDGLEGTELIAEVGARDQIAAVVRRTRPDVLVIDDRLVASRDHVLARLGPVPAGLRMIVVGVDDDPAFAARAHRLGAEAWVAKDRADEELPRLLEAR